MGRIDVIIDNELEKRIRVAIAEVGGKHGELKKVIENSLNMWLELYNKTKTEIYNNKRTNYVIIDETMEFVTRKSLTIGDKNSIIDIKCPCGYKIIIIGKRDLISKNNITDAHVFTARIADKNNIEISPNTKISIKLEKPTGEMILFATMNYEDINRKNNKIKPDDNVFRFEVGTTLNEGEYLKVYVSNPNIDIDCNNIKFILESNMKQYIL